MQSKPGEVKQAIVDAIDIGYRHFDCAYVYENETEIGAAFKEKIKNGDVIRQDLFIVSKVYHIIVILYEPLHLLMYVKLCNHI